MIKLFDLVRELSIVYREIFVDFLHEEEFFMFFEFVILVIFEFMFIEVVKVTRLEMVDESLFFQFFWRQIDKINDHYLFDKLKI